MIICMEVFVLRSFAVAAVLSVLLAVPSAAQISLDADFDHGSLLSWTSQGDTINLVGRDNFYGGGRWRWVYFRADDIAQQQPTFEISTNFAGGESRLVGHEMVYSYDNENWHFFENNQVRDGRFAFSNDSPFEQESVYVAYSIPYSYDRSVQHTARVLNSPWAQPTVSADINGVIGQSAGGVDDLGRAIPPQDLFAYRITNPATDGLQDRKRKVVIATGLHAAETLGAHTFEGLVDWLVSDDADAARLRNVAEIYAYPVLNPDGRIAGFNRSTIENENRDPNHLWTPLLWSTYREVQVTGEAMIADVASTPGITDAFIDFHSTMPAFPNEDFGFLEFEQGDNQADFWVEFKRLQPNIREVDSTSTTWTTANFAERNLDAAVDITFEAQHGFDRPVEYYRQLGANFGIAFHNAWVSESEFDFDNDGLVILSDVDALVATIVDGLNDLAFDLTGDQRVDSDDLDAWLSGAALENGFASGYLDGDADLNGMVDSSDLNVIGVGWQQTVAGWSRGDFDANGVVNSSDLNLLGIQWQQSSASILVVPEPASWAIAVCLSALLFRRNRISR